MDGQTVARKAIQSSCFLLYLQTVLHHVKILNYGKLFTVDQGCSFMALLFKLSFAKVYPHGMMSRYVRDWTVGSR